MAKFFNTTGFCKPSMHYMVNPFRGLLDDVYKLIQSEQYFLVHAPRQTGKTTFLHSLAHQINSEGKYIASVVSLESAGYQSITVESANKVFISSLYRTAQIFLEGDELPPSIEKFDTNQNLFGDYLTSWSNAQSKPIVLLIDEVDSLYDDVLVSTLRQLRNGFQTRPKGFPQSVVLVGLRDIREYRTKARAENPSIGAGSPFNIKTKSYFLNIFSKEEVFSLMKQHTDETGQAFSNEVFEKIYLYSGGQPWLTNALLNEIVRNVLKEDFSKEITIDHVIAAKEKIISERQTHLDSLADKLREPRVRSIVMTIISGDAPLLDDWNDNLRYCLDLGIVKAENGSVDFANPIYREIATRVLNSTFQGGLTGQEDYTTPPFLKHNGNLDMDKLLKSFQQFYRENSEHWLDRFEYKEAGHQLLLMAFLQRIINGGGRIEREMAVGSGRVDLAIYWKDEVFAIEMKLKRLLNTEEKGMIQLNRYLDILKLKKGYLVLFNLEKSAILPWDERIIWRKSTFKGKKITVVEM
jgi:hypothetical protein